MRFVIYVGDAWGLEAAENLPLATRLKSNSNARCFASLSMTVQDPINLSE